MQLSRYLYLHPSEESDGDSDWRWIFEVGDEVRDEVGDEVGGEERNESEGGL